MENFQVYAASAALGVVAGLRSMTAPAVVSRAAASGTLSTAEPRLQWLASSTAANVFLILAVGELVADKTSFIPNRTDPGPLFGRILSGGLCGAMICSSRKKSVVAGSLLGGLAAIGGAFLGYHIRKHAVQVHDIPDLQVALAEDAVAVSGGILALDAIR